MNPELEKQLFIRGREKLPNVLVAAAECAPLSKTGGLADVAGGLPKYLNALGFDARVITPYHRVVREKYGDKVEYLGFIYVDLGWRHEYAGILRLVLDGLTIYLIDSEYYFGGPIYRGGQAEVEQYAFFQRAVLECMHLLDFEPEILHCNDWHTAFLPFLIKTQYQGRPQGKLKTILTIHNIAFQGWMPYETAGDLFGVDGSYMNEGAIGHWGCANMLKTGCLFADKVNTVSPSYADEIRTIEFGEKLEYTLNCRGRDVCGILNGIDVKEFDPAVDPNIRVHYDAEHPEGRLENKRMLLEELGLNTSLETPLFAMVTRMTSQKGFDLVIQAMDRLMERDAAFVLLGSGDKNYEDAMRGLQARYPGRVCAYIGYSESLARRIYSGSDFFLMPSAFEPCGLGQIIAMRYGSLPIVHEVGGLRDTVTAYNKETGDGTGFSFWDFNADTMMEILDFALDTYRDKTAMAHLIHSAMTADFSMETCALEYAKFYMTVLPWGDCGLRHISCFEMYRMPFGAVKCGETVRLRLGVTDYPGGGQLIAGGQCYPMEREEGGFLGADFTVPETPALVPYCFRLDNGAYFCADGPTDHEAEPWYIAAYDPAFETPEWANGTVVYQIVPDRFAPGGDAFDKGVRYHRVLGRHVEVHRRWEEPVKFQASTRDEYYPDDFYGGTLRGITDLLPELQKMGVGCICLNSVFESDSNHRGNVADYHKIDPMLGDEGELRALCSEAKAHGIRVILDGVFTHVGEDSVYFDKEGRYEGVGAYRNKDSQYASWFNFYEYPAQYQTWRGIRSLPQVNTSDANWRNFAVTGEGSVMKRWLGEGADGWRLDMAEDLSDETLRLMRDSVKSADPEALLLGEIWGSAAVPGRDILLGHALDGAVNYPLRSAVLDFMLFKSNAVVLRDVLVRQKMDYPAPFYHCLLNLMGSHDTARLRTILGSGRFGEDMSKEEQAAFRLSEDQDIRGRALQKLCAAIQYALPGLPCVYYGDEEGMQGFRDPFCRAPFVVASETDSLREFYTELGEIRNDSEVLRSGDAAFAAYGDDVLVILRWIEDEAWLVAINRGNSPAAIEPRKEDFIGLPGADARVLPKFPVLKPDPMDYVIVNIG